MCVCACLYEIVCVNVLVLVYVCSFSGDSETDLHMVFVDLEKAFDGIPRYLIWWCLRNKGVPEEYDQIVQDMYRSCMTQVVTQKGETEYFPMEVGLHQ